VDVGADVRNGSGVKLVTDEDIGDTDDCDAELSSVLEM
jgi:hypothetical protein